MVKIKTLAGRRGAIVRADLFISSWCVVLLKNTCKILALIIISETEASVYGREFGMDDLIQARTIAADAFGAALFRTLCSALSRRFSGIIAA